MSIDYQKLNNSQKKAVDWNTEPLLVLAGPGSGKTVVLTLRIVKLINATPNDNFRILGLTFTVKAATEMKSRIKALLGEDNRRIQLKTFHSFCTDLLRQHGSHVGLRPDFSVITDDKDRIAMLKELHEKPDVNIDDPEDLLKKIDILFTHGINLEESLQCFDDNQQEQGKVLQNLFSCYLNELVAQNQLDFGSMLYFARKILETLPRIARQVRTVYRFVCVDEFQDTNLAQYHILKMIARPKDANLFVVADDDQVIFQWNGADPKRLTELKNDYSLTIIQLPENYRCPQDIVAIANRLIKNNTGRLNSKVPYISNIPSGTLKVLSYDNFDQELAGLSSEIQSIPANRRETCLVIARSNKLLRQAQVILQNNEIAAAIVSKNQNYGSSPVLIIYFCLKLANATDSRSILNKLCSVATIITGITLSAEEIVAKAEVEDISYLRSFFNMASNSEILLPLCDIGQILLCDSMQFLSFIEQSFQHFDQSNMQTHSDDDLYPDYSNDKDNWQRIANNIQREYENRVSLHIFLQEMDFTPKSTPMLRHCVRLQTVHTAKGMQFDHVYVIGLAEDHFPSYFAIKNGRESIEEERRNCFVAITRSSKYLYLSYAREYFGWSKKPSRFLKEMGAS